MSNTKAEVKDILKILGFKRLIPAPDQKKFVVILANFKMELPQISAAPSFMNSLISSNVTESKNRHILFPEYMLLFRERR